MAALTDTDFMARALELAARAKGQTSPNPAVGAVVVQQGRIVGQGYHRRAGEAHAEIVALKDAAKAAKGATLYVTLEPCCHSGRTGPCTEAIISAGVGRVVYSVSDPNPQVNGRGARRLRRAGIAVTGGVMRREAEELNEMYLHYQRTGRPFVTLKLAQTLDGRIAASNGESKWITGPPARTLVHQMRREHDAIAVGMGTVRADNPSLTVRRVRGYDPYRLVVSSTLKFPASCKLIENNHDHRTICVSTRSAISRFRKQGGTPGLSFWQVASAGRGKIDLSDMLTRAADFGLRSVLVEGGARLASSLLRENLVNKMVVFVAPRLLGNGLPALADLGVTSLSDSLRLDRVTVSQCGADAVVIGYPRTGEKA